MPLELVITEGLFILDGGEWAVTNNVWLVGNDQEVMVIDAGHDHAPIVEAVAGRRVTSIASTHGHNDHINSAVALRDEVDAPILLHPDDRMLWDMVYADDAPDRDLVHGATLRVAGHELAVIHTPGHSPGSCCFWDAGSGLMFSGDTLFNGGPGATGRSFSDRPTLLRSIRDQLLVLPDETIVHTGHGDSTTIGSERAGLLDRIARLGVD